MKPLPPPGPVDVGVVAALPIEIGPFLERLRGVRTYADPEGRFRDIVEGTLDDRLIALTIAGVGRNPAARGTRRLLGGHRPRWLLSAGFGGALDPSLRRNDVVFANEIIDATRPDLPPLEIVLRPPETTAGASFRSITGRLVTVPAIVRTSAEKAALRARFGADLVDMETAAVAAVCADRNQRFLSIRVVSDQADADLPPEIMSIMGPTGGFRLGATLGALWKRPGSVKDLWALREHANEAAERLAEVLPGIIAGLT